CCATPRNWRSFTGIQRKTNARTRRTPAFALLAFIYRDVAEMERRFVGAAECPRRRPANRPLLPAPGATCPSGTCSVSLGPGVRGQVALLLKMEKGPDVGVDVVQRSSCRIDVDASDAPGQKRLYGRNPLVGRNDLVDREPRIGSP